MSANEHAHFNDALPASGLLERICLERMWRAVWRPPCPAFGHGAIGLCACRRAAPLLSSRALPGGRLWLAPPRTETLRPPGESRGPAFCFALRALDSGVRGNDERREPATNKCSSRPAAGSANQQRSSGAKQG